MPHLPFISDNDLLKAANLMVAAVTRAAARIDADPYKNVIDPFSALVDAARQSIPTSEWMEQEKTRQAQKALQNAVGNFHQDILGSLPGWENAGRGGSYDVRNTEKKIIAEVKNKYNTMNARSALSVYDSLARHLDYGNPGFKAYIVQVVPERPEPYEIPFTPTERKVQRQFRANLVRIDGQSFYAMASGYPDALKALYAALPDVLGKILGIYPQVLTQPAEYRELFGKVYGM